MDCLKPKILEFMGPSFIKPWNWWSYLFMDLSWKWFNIRNQLNHTLGTTDGIIFIFLSLFPLLFVYLTWCMTIRYPFYFSKILIK